MKLLYFLMLSLFLMVINYGVSFKLLKDFLQFNIAGHPVLHKDVEWVFQPNLGKLRSKEYQTINGRLGEKLIEKLGLGIDGKQMERLFKQHQRDDGHLNGLDADELSE